MELHLITESAFHTAYLLRDWCAAEHNNRGNIVMRAIRPENLRDRITFHHTHRGKTRLSPEQWAELDQLYDQPVSEAEKAMIARYGIPELPDALLDSTVTRWVGSKLNEGNAVSWLQQASAAGTNPRFFVFLDRILKEPWQGEMEKGRIFNAHSARLPYAAGMYAIENIAAMNDPEKLRRAAGATIHYVDPKIDEGPTIQAKGFTQPIQQFKSIWELKGASYHLAFDMLANLAKEFTHHDKAWRPAAKKQDLSLRIAPHFRSTNFTPEIREKAVNNFLRMRRPSQRNLPH